MEKVFDEFREKIRLYRNTQNESIKEEIAEKHIYLCERYAKKYSDFFHMDYEELLGFAYEGLTVAINDYDLKEKKTFYQVVIEYIFLYIEKGIAEMLHMDINVINILYDYLKFLEREYGLSPTDKLSVLCEIIDKLFYNYGLSEQEVQAIYNGFLIRNHFSYDYLVDSIERKENIIEKCGTTTYSAEEKSLIKLEQDTFSASGDVESNSVIAEDLINQVHIFLDQIPLRKKVILENVYGIGQNPKTYEEIGRELGCSKANVGGVKDYTFETILKGHYIAPYKLHGAYPIPRSDVLDQRFENIYIRTRKND